MSLVPILRYSLDLSGNNSNNLVVGEVHALAAVAPNRTIVPEYGAFYTESLVVRLEGSLTNLQPGIDFDYVPTHLHQEATHLSGKEVCQLIVIINQALMGNIVIEYQSVGGEFSVSTNALQQLIETLQLDERPVVWGEIIGLPNDFPPSSHFHPLSDFYGFGNVVDALEGIRQALLASGAPDFTEIYQYLASIVMGKTYPAAEMPVGETEFYTYIGSVTVPAGPTELKDISFRIAGLGDNGTLYNAEVLFDRTNPNGSRLIQMGSPSSAVSLYWYQTATHYKLFLRNVSSHNEFVVSSLTPKYVTLDVSLPVITVAEFDALQITDVATGPMPILKDGFSLESDVLEQMLEFNLVLNDLSNFFENNQRPVAFEGPQV